MKYLLYAFVISLVSFMFTACGQNEASEAKTAESGTAATSSDTIEVETSVDFVTGQFDFTTHDDFVQVDPQYANKEIYLQKEVYRAFKAMTDSAAKEGITFTLVSGTRNFPYQKSIWDRKWQASDAGTGLGKAQEILEYSSMPMTSRHHWGTDIDLNELNNSYFESGQGKKEYDWLQAHANDFGFYQPYTPKDVNGRTGYNEEKWHWSYMPLAAPYLAYYNQHVTNTDIQGFEGSDLADEIDMVKNYVNGVSEKVKEYSEK